MKFGYTILYVEDVPKTIEFYENAFGMKRSFITETGDYAQLDGGAVALGFANHTLASSHGFGYNKTPAPPFEIALVSENVQADFDHAVKCGAKILSKPSQKPWGQVVAHVQDLNGFIVEICSPMGGGPSS
ncbi:hypothetical protein HDU98_002504 [Podochytrium sp. JEL0797]|nr:hypothetical protein HDU98_002504 [Podochytrium sp. JEL0797]